jgi:hypothetical protein
VVQYNVQSVWTPAAPILRTVIGQAVLHPKPHLSNAHQLAAHESDIPTELDQLCERFGHVVHGCVARDVDNTIFGDIPHSRCVCFTIRTSGRAGNGDLPVQRPLGQGGGGLENDRHAARQQRVEEAFPSGEIATCVGISEENNETSRDATRSPFTQVYLVQSKTWPCYTDRSLRLLPFYSEQTYQPERYSGGTRVRPAKHTDNPGGTSDTL